MELPPYQAQRFQAFRNGPKTRLGDQIWPSSSKRPKPLQRICLAWVLGLGLVHYDLYSLSVGLNDKQAVTRLLFEAALAGYLGARLPSLILKRGSLLSRSGYWFQAGMLGSTLTILSTPFTRLDMVDGQVVLSAAIVSIPVGQGLGRLGCHFAGCCGSPNLLMKKHTRTNSGCQGIQHRCS
jgi:prolipoprotein diacylglyceryltransferase